MNNEKITAWVLDEATPAERCEIQTALAASPELRQREAETRAFCARLADDLTFGLSHEGLSSEQHAELEAQLLNPAPPKPLPVATPRPRNTPWLSIAAGLMIAGLLATNYWSTGTPEQRHLADSPMPAETSADVVVAVPSFKAEAAPSSPALRPTSAPPTALSAPVSSPLAASPPVTAKADTRIAMKKAVLTEPLAAAEFAVPAVGSQKPTDAALGNYAAAPPRALEVDGPKIAVMSLHRTTDGSGLRSVFSGNVSVKHPDWDLKCDEAQVTESARNVPLAQLIATGPSVVLTHRSNGKVAIGRCAKVMYQAAAGEFVMSGKPSIQSGQNLITATDPATTITLTAKGEIRTSGPIQTTPLAR